MGKHRHQRLRLWAVRAAWLFGLWAVSVTALGIVAGALRIAMRATGLTD